LLNINIVSQEFMKFIAEFNYKPGNLCFVLQCQVINENIRDNFHKWGKGQRR